VAQNRQGGGAELTLRFPVSSVQVLAVPPPRLPRAVRRKGSLRVLVVDDSAENLSVTCQVLEAEGMRVRTAEGGAAALRTLRKSRFDLILCDLGMPGITGWQVAQAARRLAPATPFFLLTGWAKEISDDDERRKLVAGVLPKPVEVDDLRALLSKLAS
jgi:CheY-like chemotaxis protein